jgi:hypothetical protein
MATMGKEPNIAHTSIAWQQGLDRKTAGSMESGGSNKADGNAQAASARAFSAGLSFFVFGP